MYTIYLELPLRRGPIAARAEPGAMAASRSLKSLDIT